VRAWRYYRRTSRNVSPHLVEFLINLQFDIEDLSKIMLTQRLGKQLGCVSTGAILGVTIKWYLCNDL
jgi:hypothetical protein